MSLTLLRHNSLLLNTPQYSLTANVLIKQKEYGMYTIEIIETQKSVLLYLSSLSSSLSSSFSIPICETSFVVNRPNDTTLSIISKNNDMNEEYTLIFTNSNSCKILWYCLSCIVNKFFLPLPTVSTINSLSSFLCSLHPIMYSYFSKQIINSTFINTLYETFTIAELHLQFDILPLFHSLVISLFDLQSKEIVHSLLSVENINNTIACLEYTENTQTLQTAHRSFLQKTFLQHVYVLPFHKKFSKLAETLYRIYFIRNIIEYVVTKETLSSIDSVILEYNQLIINNIISEKHFEKKILASICPVIISVNDSVVLVSKPNISCMKFLISLLDLLTLNIQESLKKRIIRKLYNSCILERLESVFIKENPQIQRMIVTIFIKLYNIDPDGIRKYVTQSDMISTLIKNIYPVNENIDIILEFIYMFTEKYDVIPVSADRKIIEFINRLIKEQPSSMHLSLIHI
jgi:hypothetical protein